MIVLDASAILELLLRTPLGSRVEELLQGERALRHAPHLLDVEVAQVLRRFVSRGVASAGRAREVIADLQAFPLRRHEHTLLLPRVFALRDNFSAYDAVYVALAEALDATLVTCDGALAGAPGHRARVELVS